MRARALFAALGLVAAMFAGGCGGGDPSPRPAAQQFLDAVARADYATAGRLAGVPAQTVRMAYRSFLTALSAPRIGLRLGTVRADAPHRSADAAFTATVAPGGFGVLTYTGHLHLTRTGRAWRVGWAPTVVHPALTAGRHVVLTRTFGPRAPILDAAGRVLVADAPVVTVGVHPKLLHDRAAELATLARVVGVDVTGLRRAVAAAAPDAFVPVITLRRSAFARVRPALDRLPGVPYRAGTAPLAPTPTFARALLGRVGPATAEALAALGPPYRAGDEVGLYGLQGAFERRLAGSPTARVVVEDAKGRQVATLTTYQGRPGRPLRVTLDRRVQQAAEAALDTAPVGTHHASLVAVRPSTGAILAVANRPADSSYDAALVGRYPPGSTFKIVTTTALLGAGVRPDDPVPCPPSVDVAGKRFTNFQGESAPGRVPLRTDFAMSCNTAFVGLAAKRLGSGDLHAAASAYGFGGSWQLPLPAYPGSVPVAVDPVERVAQAIGQGHVLASPLDMAMVAATVASGTWQAPQLVADQGARPSPRALPPAVAAGLRGLMRSVVTRGTARQAFAHLGGPPVYGKTGTAEYGTGNPPATHAWFVGYRGDVAFAVIVEGGGVGGAVAAPVAASFVRALGGA